MIKAEFKKGNNSYKRVRQDKKAVIYEVTDQHGVFFECFLKNEKTYPDNPLRFNGYGNCLLASFKL